MTSLTELSKQLTEKKISSVELTQDYLARIQCHNPTLNAFITISTETAQQQAKRADEQRARGQATPLTGIPIAHKDIFMTKGLKTSCASKMLADFIAPFSATLVEKLELAGMVMLGKTNMDEFAMGSANENSFYGPVKNPWQLNYVPGGSSGGSAAAVAAHLTPAATGTDTGGSIRQPAAFCGITGIKPTYGRISRWGMIAFASSLDQAGPMAQTAQDCALLLEQMAGLDPRDATSSATKVSQYSATLEQSLSGLRIGVPQNLLHNAVESEIENCILQALKTFEQLGAQIVEIDLPHCQHGVSSYYIVAPAEASSNLARFDGVRYGYRCQHAKDLTDLYCRSRGEGFGEEVKRRILVGTYALASGYYDAYYLKAQKVRRLIANEFQQAFAQVDTILTPTTPTTAFQLKQDRADPISLYHADKFTIPANLAGLPAISLPCGFVNALPVGLQLFGNYFAEARLLNIAHQFQQHTEWHQQPAPFVKTHDL